MFGAILNSGDPVSVAKQFASAYPQYISATEGLQAAKAAETQVKFNAAQDRAAAREQTEAIKRDFNTKASALVVGAFDDNGNKQVLGPDYMKAVRQLRIDHPGLPPSDFESLMKFGQNEDKILVSHPDVEQDFMKRVINGDTDTLNVDMAKANGIDHTLADKDMARIQRIAKSVQEDPINPRSMTVAMDAAKSKLLVPTAFSDFQHAFLEEYTKLPVEQRKGALNFQDKNSLINQWIDTFNPSDAEKMQYQSLKGIGLGTSTVGDYEAAKKIPEVPGTPTVPPNLRQFVGQGLVQKGDQYRVNGRTYNKYGDEIKNKNEGK